MIAHFVVDVAATRELSLRQTPAGRIGVAAGDVRWDGVSREEPDAHGFTGPFCGIDATAVGVEATAKAAVVGTADGAAGVCGLTGSVDVAVGGFQRAGEGACVGDCATGVGVHSHVVRGLGTDTFDDVDFSVVGPVRAEHPEGRPRPTSTSRHMCEIEDDEAVLVCVFAGYTYTVSTTPRGSVCRIDSHIYLTILKLV